jgi:hypothetical protein
VSDQATFELSEDSTHLPNGGAHRVVRVVLEDLTAVTQAERMAPSTPNRRQDALLLGHLPSETVEGREDYAVDSPVLDRLERFVQPMPGVHAIRAADALVRTPEHDPMVVGFRPGTDIRVLRI